MRARIIGVVVLAGAVVAAAANNSISTSEQKPEHKQAEKAEKSDTKPDSGKKPLKSKTVSSEERVDALSRATVWTEPPPIAGAQLGADPKQPKEITCTFEITQLGGTAPKFDCKSENGDRLRIKYGRTPEVPSEVAAAKLLRTLGFGADNVILVEKVRCYGCPAEPFATMKTLGFAGAQKLYEKVMDPKSYQDFEWAAVETKHYGRAIETQDVEGWAFFEADLIDPKKGGAPRAHVDALRLLAVFLSHWDNKSENQRLVCLSEKDWPDGGKCSKPFAMLQDVGSAWGPRKTDLPEWEKAPVWSDRATCTTSMDHLPYHGATFKPVQISEAGRKHLGGLLSQLSDQQLEDMFRSARFDQPTGMLVKHSTPISEWVRVFKAKVKQITDGPSCPQ
ncbi:MAG TPA: hypothetical protein VM096_09190 [Vicinamibacterales bacterium]|nr:hypothetical protein [Vicinamibacterales bacterium]